MGSEQTSCLSSTLECLPKNEQLTIWGDHFNQDTRALLIICEMAGKTYKFREVNTFKEENFSKKYVELNPTSSIPIITCRDTKCIGDQSSLYQFLYNTDPYIKSMFFCDDQALQIKNLMDWLCKVMRQSTSKLIRRIYIQRVLKVKNRKSVNIDLTRFKQFFTTYLTHLEALLATNKFLTGQQMTYVDILIYVEIHTIIRLYSWHIEHS